jgi:hypothetical protein
VTGYLGIDFSGSPDQWRPAVRRPTVWIATLEGENPLRLTDLRPVQELPGSAPPFERLVGLLRAGRFAAAAIDAPFSLPAAQCPPGGRSALLDAVLRLPLDGRPFPRGPRLIDMARAVQPWACKKPLRPCEAVWRSRGVNTRSTLWWTPRGGAPFAAACLTLLARAGRPCWPWEPAGDGILLEAFPAGQIRQWGLNPNGYSGSGPDHAASRRAIVAEVGLRAELPASLRSQMEASPDALDAVIAAFAAYAVRTGRLAAQPEEAADGWIAVMA